MSAWTHNICRGCWREQEGERLPTTIKDAPLAACCWCGWLNSDGIYKRADPTETPCKGNHEGDRADA